ncbi:hypothetical protein EDC04DRAFT_2913600 [Pisolithus marmoratus]|nr:hypothetical protein EDC04DRAFT_2913600 [Pisolithus marmoratus]
MTKQMLDRDPEEPPRYSMGEATRITQIFINSACGSELRTGSGLESCTNEVQTSLPFKVGGKQVVLLDTPGFDDTSLTHTDVLKIISAYLVAMVVSYPPYPPHFVRLTLWRRNKQGARLVGVIYMQRISDLKIGVSARRDLRMFQELCGEEACENVIVATNMWGTVPEEDGIAREAELAFKDIFYKPILERKGRTMRHDNMPKSTHRILEELRELAEGVDIMQTAAFRQLDRELSEMAAQHQKDLEKLKSEMALAEQEMDEETQQELAE